MRGSSTESTPTAGPVGRTSHPTEGTRARCPPAHPLPQGPRAAPSRCSLRPFTAAGYPVTSRCHRYPTSPTPARSSSGSTSGPLPPLPTSAPGGSWTTSTTTTTGISTALGTADATPQESRAYTRPTSTGPSSAPSTSLAPTARTRLRWTWSGTSPVPTQTTPASNCL